MTMVRCHGQNQRAESEIGKGMFAGFAIEEVHQNMGVGSPTPTF